MRLAFALAVLILLAGCECGRAESTAQEEPIAEPAPALPALVPPARLAGAGLFALAPTSEGALLIWVGEETEDETGEGEAPRWQLRAQALSSVGAPAGGAVALASEAPGSVRELVAAGARRTVAAAWVVEDGEGARSRSVRSSTAGRTFSPPQELGPAAQGGLGQLAITASAEESFLLLHRIPAGDCRASSGRCERFTRSFLAGPGQRRGDEPLEIPDPCEPLLLGALAHGDTFYYAACHGGVEPVATLFGIRPRIYYAVAHEVLAGCAALALLPLDQGIGVIGECGGEALLWTLGEVTQAPATLRSPSRSARCERGRPTLHLRDPAGQERTIHLGGGSLGGIARALPPEMSPPGALAVWTDEVVLVASPEEGRARLRRYGCVGERLVER